MDEELLTVEEAAARVKMHVGTVRRLLREGTLPGVKLGKRQWRISTAALRKHMEGGSASPTPEPGKPKKGK